MVNKAPLHARGRKTSVGARFPPARQTGRRTASAGTAARFIRCEEQAQARIDGGLFADHDYPLPRVAIGEPPQDPLEPRQVLIPRLAAQAEGRIGHLLRRSAEAGVNISPRPAVYIGAVPKSG